MLNNLIKSLNSECGVTTLLVLAGMASFALATVYALLVMHGLNLELVQ